MKTKRNLTLLTVALFLNIALARIANAQYIHAGNSVILNGKNQPIQLAGVNLGNYFVFEGYMMNLDAHWWNTHTGTIDGLTKAFGGGQQGQAKAATFVDLWRRTWVNEKTFQELKTGGFNLVRVPFHYNMFWKNNQLSDEGFQYFDLVIQNCKKYGMYALFDLHAAPGYQNHKDNSDNPNTDVNSIKLWTDTNNLHITYSIWKHIAAHYYNEPVIAGWDLLNEPVVSGDVSLLLKSYKRMTAAIRSVDKNHAIFAEGNWFGCYFNDIVYEKWDNNLVFETHHYPDQNVIENFDTRGSTLWSRLVMANSMGFPMFLGEYGENDPKVIENITNWVNKKRISYTAWSFKRVDDLNRELWKVNKTNGFNDVTNWIRNGANGNPPGNAYSSMVDFLNQAANGGSNLEYRNDYYNAIKPLPNLTLTNTEEHSTDSDQHFAFPNPAENSIQLSASERISSVEVVSTTGVRQLGFVHEQVQKSLDISSLAKGCYILKIKDTDNNLEIKRLIIQ